MTPEVFLSSLQKKKPSAAYLFLGPEAYQRERCRRALIDAVLPAEDRERGFARHDLDQTSLAEALAHARSMSLFASQRVIWLGSAEAALPRGKASEEDEGDAAVLAAYLNSPTPGTVVV